jgi:pantoate kinase
MIIKFLSNGKIRFNDKEYDRDKIKDIMEKLKQELTK